MRIEGNAFLVTGGSSGLGEAVVRMLVESGGRAVIADIDAEKGKAVVESIGAAVRYVHCDVANEADANAAVNAALDGFGNLRGLIGCAGVPLVQRVVGRKGPHSLEDFTRLIQINLIGTFNVLRLAAAAMIRQEPMETGERGVIVNTSSTGAFEGQIGQAADAAAKGGINSMTLPIARELGSWGIRVVTIAPGMFDTPMMNLLPNGLRAALGAQVPFPSRFGMPAEFAALARHVIENEMINGEIIRLDGAQRMGPRI
ncbi:MAG TPA: SDR family NAD(P)-dependent oxidoreductase [Candidatus Hydrogenedentes bacterium]|nr:SDR family NAD(P)-dependent oxidoreductase [Candidatus Hydrogenedentota bacterium]